MVCSVAAEELYQHNCRDGKPPSGMGTARVGTVSGGSNAKRQPVPQQSGELDRLSWLWVSRHRSTYVVYLERASSEIQESWMFSCCYLLPGRRLVKGFFSHCCRHPIHLVWMLANMSPHLPRATKGQWVSWTKETKWNPAREERHKPPATLLCLWLSELW